MRTDGSPWQRSNCPYLQVRIEERCTDEWIDAFCRLSRKDEQEKKTMSQTLRNIIPSSCYGALYCDGEVVACEYIGLFDIVTGPSQRRRGFAGQLVQSLLRWGTERGAKHSCLQVMQDNAPALRLYEKLGYKEVYSYWYRIRPMST